MLQAEVAARLVAAPGSKLYGRLSILSQYHCKMEMLLNVKSEYFYPIPKVNSIFVRFIPYVNSPYFVYDINILSYITNLAFQKRRKILSNSLNKLFSTKTLIQLQVDPKSRAENISILQYCQLSNYLYKQ